MALASAPCGVAKSLARFGESFGAEGRDQPPEGVARDRMDVVEVDHAVGGNAVTPSEQVELRDKASPCARECCDDDGADALGDWVAGEDEDWTITTRRGCEPDVTSLHRPSRPSPRQVPTRRFRRVPA